MNNSIRRINLRKNLLLVILFALILGALWLIYSKINVFPLRDFVEYWASGKLNLSGGNPYDTNQMLMMEKSAGWSDNGPVMMLNPPLALPYAMFFGLFNYPFSRFLGFVLQMSIAFLCAIQIWGMVHGEKRKEWIGWVLMFTFGPLLHTLKAGQVTILVLLGSVCFLYFLNKKNDFWAGVFASLVLIKPHLLYLFFLAVVVWSFSNHRFRIISGILTMVAVSIAIAWVVNPHILSQYIDMLRYSPTDLWMTSTIGGYLRRLLGPEIIYLQYLPSFIGLCWFIFFWKRHHTDFDWSVHTPIIILVSFVTTAYGWTFDAAVVVWVVIQIAVLFNFRNLTFGKILVFITYWGLNLLISLVSISQNNLWWFPSSLLIWYIISHAYMTKLNTKLSKRDNMVGVNQH